ncbi:ABC transporter permease [Nocardioides agariphilus]|uniref:ABC transporter permease n=1 Tax=Nocardioides agariphilus TaxID=433664 RepID=A0A930VRH8_9ACTN|nr:ABC transporter permease [Nocardioides agariphilus]MBF4769357.1 ABC transporter permease [Nocardioides agariphilus]
MSGRDSGVAEVTDLAAVGIRRAGRPGIDFWTLLGTPAMLVVLVAFGVPLFMVVYKSATDPGLVNYTDVMGDPVFRKSLFKTIEIAVAATLAALLLGYPYAYVMARSGRWMRSFLLVALMVSFWTSLLIRTFAWQVLLQNTGVINTELKRLGLIDTPLPIIRNEFAALVGMTQMLAPFLILAVYALIRAIPPELEQAAMGMGARRSTMFRTVVLPLSMPGVAAGCVLVFVLALGFYITPQVLGGPSERMVGQSIAEAVHAFVRPGLACAMAVILLLLVGLVLAATARFMRLSDILKMGSMSE